jgi:hypothetical protein
VRHHDKPIHIEHASLGIIGGLVPDRLRETLAGADDGLTARILYTWPELPPIGPLANGADSEAAQRRITLFRATRHLRHLAMGKDNFDAPAPIVLRLDRDAFALFDEIQRDAKQKSRAAHGLAAGWHGKNPGRALRLALVYELLAWAPRGDIEPAPASVSADSVARAATYLDYASEMLDRVTGGLALTQAEADAAAIARHLKSTRPACMNERELTRRQGFAGHGKPIAAPPRSQCWTMPAGYDARRQPFEAGRAATGRCHPAFRRPRHEPMAAAS